MVRHCREWDCEFALEHGKSDESQTVGVQDLTTDNNTTNESHSRSGTQEDDV